MQNPYDCREITADKRLACSVNGMPVFSSWLVFGEHDNGDVDIMDCDGDVLTNVPADKARVILRLREEFVASILKVLH